MPLFTACSGDRVLRQRRRAVLPVVASWGMASALLLSFTARAGEGFRVVDHEFRRSTMIEAHRLTLMPPRMTSLLVLPHQERAFLARTSDEAVARIAPHIRKVDLARDIVPSPSGILPLVFARDALLFPANPLDATLTLSTASRVLMRRLARFEGRTDPANNPGRSSLVAAQGGSPQSLTQTRPEGTTPVVSRALLLSSVTPASMEPEVIAASAMRLPTFAHVHSGKPGTSLAEGTVGLHRNYASLIHPEQREEEKKCLAEAIYFEARSEPVEGQAAVAQVVLNRVKSGLYPQTVCGVVYQNRHRYKACQFTFTCEGKALTITQPAAWLLAQRIAREVVDGETYLEAVGASTHYHADYVSPYWSRKLKKTDRIGRHIFYKLRPGQT